MMPSVYIPTDDGRWVNSDFERLARLVNEYDEHLEFRYIPPDKRTREDKKPYIIVDTRTEAAVLHAGELDTPEDILTRLYLADDKFGNVLTRMEAHNLAVRIIENQKWLDEREDMKDQAIFLMKSPLNTVRFNGKKLDHWRRPIL
jgi:hypothetical protein